jgi:hypothetical protein
MGEDSPNLVTLFRRFTCQHWRDFSFCVGTVVFLNYTQVGVLVFVNYTKVGVLVFVNYTKVGVLVFVNYTRHKDDYITESAETGVNVKVTIFGDFLPSSCRKFTVFLEPMFRNIFSAQIPRYIGSCNFFSNLHVMD